MLFEFSTKLDRNGNRYYLTINDERKEFTTVPGWGDKIIIKKRDLRALKEQLKANEYKEKEF